MGEEEEPGADAVPEAAEVRAPSESAPGGETRTPDEWAAIVFAPAGSRPNPHAWRHSVAEALHGWALHAHHAGAPMQLTREAYALAIEAAASADSRGSYAPHAAALSPHAPKAQRG